MKWLSKLFKSGPSSRAVSTGEQQPQFLGDENMAWRAPYRSLDDRTRNNKEKEELDRAIALSMAEDLKRPNGYRWRTDNDEDLARSLHDSFNSAPYPSYVPRDYYHPRGYRTCAGCKREIGYGNYLGCMGTFYHPECFRCRACGYPITEHEFSLSGRDTYHKSCFKELTHPKCEVCHQFIPTNGVGLIEYRCHPFWSQKYCPAHEHDNTARCCSCERLESRNTTYISLGDGRSLCLECMESAIMDTGFPSHARTRGLCLSEEQTVTSILKRPRMERRGLVGIRTQPQKLIRRCEVTAILVLYGLPRLLTGAILAHELMHGWLRLNDYRNLRPEVEEGICQVLSYMWLESEVIPGTRSMPSTSTASSSSTWSYGSTSTASSSSSWSASKKGGRSSVENKLGEFFMHQIAHDASPAYGGGYRAAMAAVNKYGLRRTLDHIRYTGTFPE
ncbi:UNVERIFIED_CONTAM: protein DA1-related 2 [Sesamum latifolium]|uniref:Protein DA1-related 2 n=1 Tax=Sesamum latifolium TaxID=2727402 RepID=A0AAW2T951_9LAMI